MIFGDLEVKPAVRRLSDMKEVLADKRWLNTAADMDMYYMYRDVGLNPTDRQKIKLVGLRYDVTIIPPNKIGKEYVKTFGHYHPKIKGHGISYPELYQVSAGRAHYLLQKRGSSGELEDAYSVKAAKKDIVLIPPDYGHVSINPGDSELSMSNWVCRSFDSDYGDYKRMGGAAYFILEGERIIPNKRYDPLPRLREEKPSPPQIFGLKRGDSIYNLAKKLENLKLLTEPWEYLPGDKSPPPKKKIMPKKKKPREEELF